MDCPHDDDHGHQRQNSSPSFKQKFKSSLFCFPKSPHHPHHHHHHHHHHHNHDHHQGETVTSSVVNTKPKLGRSNSLWIKPRPEGTAADHQDMPEFKHRCRKLISRMGSGRRHARRHSADFSYDAISYALNFEEADPHSEDFPYRDFSARLPRTPPSTDVCNIDQGRTASCS